MNTLTPPTSLATVEKIGRGLLAVESGWTFEEFEERFPKHRSIKMNDLGEGYRVVLKSADDLFKVDFSFIAGVVDTIRWSAVFPDVATGVDAYVALEKILRSEGFALSPSLDLRLGSKRQKSRQCQKWFGGEDEIVLLTLEQTKVRSLDRKVTLERSLRYYVTRTFADFPTL